VEKEVEELGSQKAIEHVGRIMGEGTGADRQLRVWEATKSMPAVVDQIVQETYEGLTVTLPEPPATMPEPASVGRPVD
jgi:carboxylate-amine ligase